MKAINVLVNIFMFLIPYLFLFRLSCENGWSTNTSSTLLNLIFKVVERSLIKLFLLMFIYILTICIVISEVYFSSDKLNYANYSELTLSTQ